MALKLTHPEKMSLAATIDEVRAGILIEAEDDYYFPDDREWLRRLISSLEYAAELVSGNAGPIGARYPTREGSCPWKRAT